MSVRARVIAGLAVGLALWVAADSGFSPAWAQDPEPEESEDLINLLGNVSDAARSVYTNLARPEACFVCGILVNLVRIFALLGSAAFEILALPCLLLMVAAFAVFLVVKIAPGVVGMSVNQVRPIWRELIGGCTRFLIAIILLSGMAVSSGGSRGGPSVFDEMYHGLLAPLLGGSAALGLTLLDAVQGGGYASVIMEKAQEEANQFLDTSHLGMRKMRKSEEALMKGVVYLALGLHLVGRLGIAQAVGFISDAATVGGTSMMAWVGALIGLVMIALFAYFLIVVGVRLLDPLIRITIVFALLPLLIVAWVFGPFRSMAERGMRTFGYCCLYLVIAGVVYSVAFELVVGTQSRMMALTKSNTAAPNPVSYDQIAAALLDSGGILTVGAAPNNLSINIALALATLVVVFLAQSVIGMVSSMASMLTDYQVSESMAEQVEGDMRGAATKSLAFGAFAGMKGAQWAKNLGGNLLKGLRG